MGTMISGATDPQAAAASGESLRHPDPAEIELAAVLHALSDPVRLQIAAGLAAGEERTCKSFDLPVVKSTCTHHFRVLREAGVIRQRLDGTTRLNSLRRAELDRRFPGLLDAVLGGVGASGGGCRSVTPPIKSFDDAEATIAQDGAERARADVRQPRRGE